MHVAVIGIDGSGKSSFVQVLAESFRRQRKSVSVMEWFRTLEFRDLAIKFNNCEEMTPQILASLQASSTLALLQQAERDAADINLWDRYIYSSYASCTVRGASRKLMRSIVEMFPTPDLTILVLGEPQICFERISERGGVKFYECGLDRLYRGRLQEGEAKFKSGQIPTALMREVFIDTMTEWNLRLQEIIDPKKTLVLEKFNLSGAVATAEQIVDSLFPTRLVETPAA